MSWISKLFRRTDEQEYTYEETPTVVQPARRAHIDDSEVNLPRFKNMVGGVDGGHHKTDAERVRAKLRDAFTPSHPVTDVRMFAGREDLLLTLIRAIEDQRLHAVIYGDRGIGKTSMLHVLTQLAKEAQYTVRYTSCGVGTEFSEIFRAVAADISLLYHEDYDPTDPAIEHGGTLADKLPEGRLSVAQMTDLLSKIHGTRILIILDEFDRADSAQFRQQVAELIKNLSDRSIAVQMVIAGVASNLTELIAHIPSIRRNIMGLPIDVMNPQEIEELVKNGEWASGLKFQPKAIENIIKLSNGSPYLASLLGQHAGLAATQRDAVRVTPEDIKAAVRQALEEVRLRISPRHIVLVDKAVANGNFETLRDMAASSMANAGQILESDFDVQFDNYSDFIEPITDSTTGAYCFKEDGVVPFIWLRSNASGSE